jgi:hypothetical protein
MPNDRLPNKLLSGEVKTPRPPGCSRSSFKFEQTKVSMLLHYVSVKLLYAVSVGLARMHKTGCSGMTKFVLQVPGS